MSSADETVDEHDPLLPQVERHMEHPILSFGKAGLVAIVAPITYGEIIPSASRARQRIWMGGSGRERSEQTERKRNHGSQSPIQRENRSVHDFIAPSHHFRGDLSHDLPHTSSEHSFERIQQFDHDHWNRGDPRVPRHRKSSNGIPKSSAATWFRFERRHAEPRQLDSHRVVLRHRFGFGYLQHRRRWQLQRRLVQLRQHCQRHFRIQCDVSCAAYHFHGSSDGLLQ